PPRWGPGSGTTSSSAPPGSPPTAARPRTPGSRSGGTAAWCTTTWRSTARPATAGTRGRRRDTSGCRTTATPASTRCSGTSGSSGSLTPPAPGPEQAPFDREVRPMEHTTPTTHSRPWLAVALAAALSFPLLAPPATAQQAPAPAADACAYGYTSEATVRFGADADSGVPNRDTGDGCTVMDEIMARAPFASHGRFVAAVASVTRGHVRHGVLTHAERAAVVRAAAASRVGRPHPVTGRRSVDLSAIGLVGYTVRATMPADAAGTLGALAACGFRNIEPSGSAGNFYGYTAAELAPLTRDAGLTVPSLGVSLGNLQDDVELVAAEAHAIGARYVRVSGS